MTTLEYKDGVVTRRDLTDAERSTMEAEVRKVELINRTRPFTAEEVTDLLIRKSVNSLVVDDNTALRMLEFYPEWGEGVSYAVGFKVRRGDKLWRVRQAHTSQVGWEPEMAASLWEQICEVHDGTLDDPIPYTGNMALEDGKFYHQDYVIYRCFRGSGNPVYHALTDLVGLYVEEI